MLAYLIARPIRGVASTADAILAGDDIARAVQLGIEYDPQPPFDAGSPAKAGPELVELVAAVSDLAAAQQVSA